MRQIYRFTVESEFEGERIDKFLSFQLPEVSRSALQRLIREGEVIVDQRNEKANFRVSKGNVIHITIPDAIDSEIYPENIPLDILYEDEDLLIVNKPKDMVVHPSAGHMEGTLVNAVMYHSKDSLSGINGQIRPGIVHRIDKDTTGSLIICKNDEAHIDIAKQIKDHTVKRIYRGIVLGHVKEDEGTITSDIGRHNNDRKKMAVVSKNGKTATTHFRIIEHLKNATYMEFELETGRTHQIRVHMASIGHPLLGDTVYGPKTNPYHLTGQTLHAQTIGFVHPKQKQYMEFSAPLPAYFLDLLTKLR